MKILKGQVTWDDSFQELADCWAEEGYCNVSRSLDKFSWALADGKPPVLLHEYDRVEDIPVAPAWDIQSNMALFANDQYPLGKPWIYWPRHIRTLTNILKDGVLSYEDRTIHSIFIGAAENPVQYINRTQFDWSLAVDHFDFSVNLFSKNPHKYSNVDFLKQIRKARFGLSLEGYGPKCQRDIEYMANGIVPVFTWNTFNHYHDPLVEGIHYIYARNPREVKEKIAAISKEKWEEMSANCVEWFNQNCSIKGSFETTIKIINNE